MKKIPDIINRLWNVCGQMEVGALLTCGSGIKAFKTLQKLYGGELGDGHKTLCKNSKFRLSIFFLLMFCNLFVQGRLCN